MQKRQSTNKDANNETLNVCQDQREMSHGTAADSLGHFLVFCRALGVSSCSGEVELNYRVTAIMVGADAQAEFQPNQKLFTGKALRPNSGAWNSALSRLSRSC